MNAPSTHNSVKNIQNHTNQIEDFIESFFWTEKEDVIRKIDGLKSKQKWWTLRVIDFDDTIYSRNEVLKIKGLKYNRWINGNNWILAKYSWILDEEWNRIFWDKKIINYREKVVLDRNHESFEKNAKILWEDNLGEFIDKVLSRINQFSHEEIQSTYRLFWEEFYSDKWKSEKNRWPVINQHEIIKDVKGDVNLILTATQAPELTKIKLRQSWMDKYPYLIVENGKDKIKSIIETVLKLWYIPEKIVVYEDRPEFFFKYWELLSRLLWIRIVVNKVKIDNQTNNLDVLEERNFAFAYVDDKKQEIIEKVDNYSPWNIS